MGLSPTCQKLNRMQLFQYQLVDTHSQEDSVSAEARVAIAFGCLSVAFFLPASLKPACLCR